MHVIGTAGHVDHGKTLLIKALTGIDTDRLPEEKARGMTIDLGFAHFPGTEGEPVGVIDVPGHERFIRNMVAGAWSLDLALLVVAADDGWMQQSSDHLTVLHWMGIRNIILTITKCDRVDSKRVNEVEQEAMFNIELMTGTRVSSIGVSAINGFNIEKLRLLILSELEHVLSSRLPYPLFFVDRVFTMKGSGTVVTGSLAGSTISKQDALTLLPSEKEVKIRALQSYNSEVESAPPVSRLAVNIANIKPDEIRRGDCITSASSDVFAAEEFLFRLDKQFGEKKIRNHSEVEIALGTAHRLAEIHFFKDSQAGWIVVDDRVPASWNQPFILIRHGGSEILGAGRIVKVGKFSRSVKKRLLPLIGSLPVSLTAKDRFFLDLSSEGYCRVKPGTKPPPLEKETAEAAGERIFAAGFYDDLSKKILELAGHGGGIAFKELLGKTGVAKQALDALCSNLVKEKKIVMRNRILTLPGTDDSSLSPFSKNLISQAKSAGSSGIEASRLKFDGAAKELKNLAKTGLLVSLDGIIFYHPETYRGLAEALVGKSSPGSRFTIAEAKERTGLSRKFMIPLLNRLEQDGFVKRDGNERVVLRTTVQ